jgi:SpoVK/Ycf46/Vps4 family AAA+-type ATPase
VNRSKSPVNPTKKKEVVSRNGNVVPKGERERKKYHDPRIQEAMDNLQGVDRAACEQILDEILIKGEKLQWDDIAGLQSAKQSLKETVVYPFLRPDLFKGLREPITGMLLFGPPGTGKTMIAKTVANESQSTFFSISASSLLSKYLGESEKLIRALFFMAKKLAPSIIFFDEIDSLLTARSDGEHESSRRVKTEFLIQWSALSSATAREDENTSRVLVLAATNLPWAIDEAARRRFTRRLYIPLPEFETRMAQFMHLMQNQKNSLSEMDFIIIANKTEGYSNSDITSLAKEAAMEPIRELGENLMSIEHGKIRGLVLSDFERAMKVIRKSVAPETLKRFEEWAARFGSTGA